MSLFKTKLTPKQELQFQDDMSQSPWTKQYKEKFGEDPNLDQDDYDMRGAWQAGVKPKIYPADGLYHWDSRFKSDDSPERYVNGIDTKSGDIGRINDYFLSLMTPKFLRKDNYGMDD